MSLANRALWVIDRNLRQELSLARVAEACGVSRYHLAHAFGESTGMSVMGYVRARRLSEAAARLAQGASNILDLALEYGYSSHEAFSRAFRAQFNTTPETVRKDGTVDRLPLVLPVSVVDNMRTALKVHRYEQAGELSFVGMGQHFSFAAPQHITAQWERFMPHYCEIENRADDVPWGVNTNLDDDGTFDYYSAVKVSRIASVPKGMQGLTLAPRTYAIFQHTAHISTVSQTYSAIWNDWEPPEGRAIADAAALEGHLPAFNPRTGLGGVELWVPVT